MAIAKKKRVVKKKASKKKSVKKKLSVVKSASKAIHIDGDIDPTVTPEMARAREKEKQAILNRATKSPPVEDDPVAKRVVDMLSNLGKVMLGQGDEHLVHQFKERVGAGRHLTDYQFDQLVMIHMQYT